MQLDARTLKAPRSFECDVCIVGAGPAGLSVARELAAHGVSVVILESGGMSGESAIQELNDGRVAGDTYAGLRTSRHRALGGTANLWNTPLGAESGAKYVPLDPWDFDSRPGSELPAWPFDATTLDPWYRRAQTRCGLGTFSYDAKPWESSDRGAWTFRDPSVLCSRIYQFGRAGLFTADYVSALRASRHAQVCDHATVVRIIRDAGDRVSRVEARATTTRITFTVAARFFVLAAGAIENARLLLTSSHLTEAGLVAGHEWVGRCFTEHPRDWSLRLIPRTGSALRSASFYDTHVDPSGVTVCGRLGLTQGAASALHPPNFSITLLPYVPPLGRFARFLAQMGIVRDRRGYGWSHDSQRPTHFDRFQLVINFEQRPRPENRVVLGSESDALGMPRAQLHWRWTAEEQAEWQSTRALIVAGIESAGLGRIETLHADRPDPNAHHHAGTTRMADDPAWGVVDRDSRVHGTSNLYVSGASVFPTSGYANPTLTVVALAIRLAEHLAPQCVRLMDRGT